MRRTQLKRDDVLGRARDQTNVWLRDFGRVLGQSHASSCYQGLRASLHALRDHLTVLESATLAAQLPITVRGIFFEGWDPSRVPSRPHSSEEVVQTLARDLADGLAAHPLEVLRAGLSVIEHHVDRSEIEHLRRALPEPFLRLWPEPGLRRRAVGVTSRSRPGARRSGA